jgi:hypothetical protein
MTGEFCNLLRGKADLKEKLVPTTNKTQNNKYEFSSYNGFLGKLLFFLEIFECLGEISSDLKADSICR